MLELEISFTFQLDSELKKKKLSQKKKSNSSDWPELVNNHQLLLFFFLKFIDPTKTSKTFL